MRTGPWKEAWGLQVLPTALGGCWEGLSARGLCFFLVLSDGGAGRESLAEDFIWEERECPLLKKKEKKIVDDFCLVPAPALTGVETEPRG